MWKDENDKIEEIWKNFLGKNERFPCFCPICNKKEGHVYLRRYKDTNARGTVWMWCSNCKNSSHGTIYLPEWWINDAFNDAFIDVSKTASHPNYLETKKDIIDNLYK